MLKQLKKLKMKKIVGYQNQNYVKLKEMLLNNVEDV